ncbi:MAG: LamG domain-containing protein [Dactylosporangium sp.]|nr:DNRLRE domain-containing protein [Dactylosporangium sp.]NNJ59919.1 LamG domain-containing protein [Dactylosporangium sp.]
MRGHGALNAALARESRRFAARPRWATRLASILAAVLVLTVAVPPGTTGPLRSDPLSWLRGWLAAGVSWAKPDRPEVPEQQRGAGASGHYLDAPRLRANGEPSARAEGELDWYQPYQPTVAGQSTGPARKGFVAATSTRIPSMGGASADVYQNVDGSYTRKVYGKPTNYQAADGSWEPIDSTLRTGTDQRAHVTANSLDISFAEAPGDLVRIGVRPGVEIAYSLAGARIDRPILAGSVAHYPSVFPDVHLDLGAGPAGSKETLRLGSADAPTEYTFPLHLTGVTPRVNANGEVEFVDAGQTVVATMPTGYMEDASADASGSGAISHGVRYELVTVDGAPAVRMSLDSAWLHNAERAFPVAVDPQVTVGTVGDTFAYSSAPDTSQSSLDNVAVGSYNGGAARARAFINFDTFPSTVAGRKLESVRLQLFMSYQGNGDGTCVARPYSVYPITSSWVNAAATWNNMPTYDTGRLLGTDSPLSTAACDNSAKIRNTGTWSSPWLNTAAMQDWASNGSIRGLAVVADETDPYAWKRFTSANPDLICTHWYFGSVQCDPFMEVNYSDNTGPQIDARYPANNAALSTLTPEFAARGSDPDSWPNTGLTYDFTIFNDQGTQIADSGWVATGWKVPEGVLSWGKTYTYTVRANDGLSDGATSVSYAFNTQVPQPMVTSALTQNAGKGFEASVGNYTTSEVDAQVATSGPALSIGRDYNSLDTRTANGFGLGWSSIPDMRVVENPDADGVLQTATIRYPNGQEVTFGRNNDGTWTPPSGRYSVFKAITGGYSLTDKDSTSYEFTTSTGGGVYAVTRILDASGRSMSFHTDTTGRIDQITSDTSQRTLTIGWATPDGAAHPHITTVTTDPVRPADPLSILTWTYEYAGDTLTRVCPPGTTTDCATYDYQAAPEYATTVLNTNPYSFWRLNEPAGQTQAKSGVLSNDGTDNGLYTDVTLGAAGPLTGSTSTAADFNGTSSTVKLPVKVATESSYQSIALWFKTSTPLGVLFGYQGQEVTPGATSTSNYNPALYVDSDGKLRGQLWTGDPSTAMTSPDAVTDGQWHHVVLAGNGASQQLYLDGQQIGDLAGAVNLHGAGLTNAYLGAGFLGGSWPGQALAAPTATFFTGQIADAAYYNKALTSTDVAALHAAATPTPVMTTVTSNAGRVRAQVGYDTVTGRVSQVVDENGGTWEVGVPTTSGSSQVYVSSVLGSVPRNYPILAIARTGVVVHDGAGAVCRDPEHGDHLPLRVDADLGDERLDGPLALG